MHAVDFQVREAGRIVAGPRVGDIATALDGAGWTDRLRESVEAADAGFVGPLRKPYEPWHNDFRPVAGSRD